MNIHSGTPNGSIDILLVEDNHLDAELLFHSLRLYRLSNPVAWAKDGEEALHVLFGDTDGATAGKTMHPKLVLLDLMLPKVDGHEVLRRIRADPVLRTIPVIVLTSSREEIDMFRCLDSGADGYIVKPVDFKNLITAIRDLGFYWLLLDEAPPEQAGNHEAIV